jgi:RimJ/RimL family protein N-acetyltransferase
VPEIPLPDPPLSDGAVALRPWREADAPALAAACQDPEIPRWTVVPSPYTEEDARDHIARSAASRTAGESLSLAMVDAETDALQGACGLGRFDWENRSAEAGYWVASEARGGSVGTRAVRLLARWALQSLRLERLAVLANPENEPSQRLAMRAGFTREGLLRSYRERKGVREDLVVFSLLPSDL